MHLLAELIVFFFGAMNEVFWNWGVKTIKRHQCRLLIRQLIFCLHICSVYIVTS